MPAPQSVIDLVERFRRNLDEYRAGNYKEAEVRQEFIDPLFKALGWDIDNEKGYAESYKEVVHEDTIKIGGKAKAPDYSFRIGGQRKFFVEAKKPSINVKDDLAPAYQVRRYAWSAKLPISILTDFEEFAVYDCRNQPKKGDGPEVGRILYFTFEDYVEKWDELVSIFSRDAIFRGDFDRYVDDFKTARGTTEVDAAFLSEIERWREALAKNFALRNADLSVRELNFAVQRTIDRIIFLRIAEDRGIEPYHQLGDLCGENVYASLLRIYQRADERYNSGLFHFKSEKGRTGTPDDLTPKLVLDDKVLNGILGFMYYPDSPYEFSVLPADILGQVYEQFLGKVIRLTDGHQAKIEEKPEVKKAGGVYYTPTYIVDYIVENTVGKLLDGKTPRQAQGMTVLDPACGSGSFLLGAYQYLLDWYRDQYLLSGIKKDKTKVIEIGPDEWRLTIEERKRILLDHIYGVDIDTQAVEVTKLSLLLKVLEGELGNGGQLAMFQQRVLPSLDANIKCGNSLIGPDFYNDQQMGMFETEEMYRINAFDWDAEFKGIMTAGGFDTVIGNPPYIRIQAMKEWAPREVEFYKERYVSASKGNYDIYVVFVERGLQLLNKEGLLGYILPHKFFNAKYGEPLRGLIAEGQHLNKVVHFGDQQIFSGATTYTCLLFLSRSSNDDFLFCDVDDLEAWINDKKQETGEINHEKVFSEDWNFYIGVAGNLMEKLNKWPSKAGDITERIAQGIRTSQNTIYVVDIIQDDGDILLAESKSLGRAIELERSLLKPFLQGREIKAYQINSSGKMVIIPYLYTKNGLQIIPLKEIEANYPKTYNYLIENKKELEEREKGRMRNENWYGYVYPKNIDVMHSKKILVPDIADRASFGIDYDGEFAFTSGYGIILNEDQYEKYEYILGLLNSNLVNFYWKNISTPLRGGFYRYFTQFIEKLPIRTINFDDPAEVAQHDRMVSLVENMLTLHQQHAAARTADEKTMLQRQIDTTDAQIDTLVYELYDLTEEEIKIVEESVN